eukprot:2408860-Pleurochrysis_carterae.AAC.2
MHKPEQIGGKRRQGRSRAGAQRCNERERPRVCLGAACIEKREEERSRESEGGGGGGAGSRPKKRIRGR